MPELREVVGHPGYFVGDDGSVWTSKVKGGNGRAAGRLGNLKPMATHLGRRGYVQVSLDVNGRNRSRLVHQLVLEAFVGPKPNGMEGCHYPDHDKRNNRLDNLRWDTHAENAKDSYRDRPPVTTKSCRRCGVRKSASDFYADKRASDGLKTDCKVCHTKVSVATRDPEKKRVANREYMRRTREAA